MADVNEKIMGLLSELRRGTIVIGVLIQLSEPRYGYSLVPLLEEKESPSIPAPCTPCCADWRSKSCWKADGRRMSLAPANTIYSPPLGRKYMRDCTWRKLVTSMEGILTDFGGGEEHGSN